MWKKSNKEVFQYPRRSSGTPVGSSNTGKTSSFRVHKRQFYKLLEGNEKTEVKPDKEKTTIRERAQEDSKRYNKKASWITNVEGKLEGKQMEGFAIASESLQKQLREVKNWTAPRSDKVHGYWFKKLTNLRLPLVKHIPHETAFDVSSVSFVYSDWQRPFPSPDISSFNWECWGLSPKPFACSADADAVLLSQSLSTSLIMSSVSKQQKPG